MATRLPIVISSHTNRGSHHSDYEESLVAELLFTDRLDATLVGPLESIASDGTDGLCLEGLKGDFAILTWLPQDTVVRELARLNIVGQLVWMANDALKTSTIAQADENDPSVNKRVYYFALEHSEPIQKKITELKSLLESKSTTTFSIQPPATKTKSATANTSKTNVDASKRPPQPLPIAKPTESNQSNRSPNPQVAAVQPNIDIDTEDFDDSIDQLFDDFENSDF